jgi:HNH endonuclease
VARTDAGVRASSIPVQLRAMAATPISHYRYPKSTPLCDYLAKALAKARPGIVCDHTGHQCPIRFKGFAAFAYVYHQKNGLKIYLVTGIDHEQAIADLLSRTSIKLQRRKSIGTEWAQRTPFIIQLYSNEDIMSALPVLLHSADRHLNHVLTRKTFVSPSEDGVDQFDEGSKMSVLVNRHERSVPARRRCIEIYGPRCSVCEFNFEEVYGSIGSGFIHVHHINPLAASSQRYKVNPRRDLRPLCPNCHEMIHRKTPPYSIQELRSIIQDTGGKT